MMPIEKRHFFIAFFRAKVLLVTEGSRTYLRYVWLLADPLLEVAIFFVIFSFIFNYSGPGYAPQLIVGLFTCRLFILSTYSAPELLINNESVMLSVLLPKYIFPLAHMFVALLKYAILLVFLCIFLLVMQERIQLSWLMIIPYTFLYSLFTFGVCMILAAAGPFFPDLTQLYPKIIMVLYWGSGVFFQPETVLPPQYLSIFYANPLARFLDAYRGCLLRGEIDWYQFAWLFIVSTAFAFVGYAFLSYFDKQYPKIITQL